MNNLSVCGAVLVFGAWLLVGAVAKAENGMVSEQSEFKVSETRERLLKKLDEKGMTVFTHISHSEGAASVGKTLRPTELIVFGNPKLGAVLMACDPRVGIDLPIKALIWEDEKGAVWLSYNTPEYLAKRHDLEGCEAALNKMNVALKGFSRAATSP